MTRKQDAVKRWFTRLHYALGNTVTEGRWLLKVTTFSPPAIELQELMSAGQRGWQVDRCWPLTVSPRDGLSQKKKKVREKIESIIRVTEADRKVKSSSLHSNSRMSKLNRTAADAPWTISIDDLFTHTNQANCRSRLVEEISTICIWSFFCMPRLLSNTCHHPNSVCSRFVSFSRLKKIHFYCI